MSLPKAQYLDLKWMEGYGGYYDGYPADRNPYKRQTEESLAWGKGWMDARREEKAEHGKTFVPIRSERCDSR